MSHETDHIEHWLRAALERYKRPLLAYTIEIIGNHATAEDLVQETFIRLSRSARQLGSGDLAPWVCITRIL